MDYWDKEADEGHGDNRRLKGDEFGPNGNALLKALLNNEKVTVGAKLLDDGTYALAVYMKGLELTAESINLNTDGLETGLASILADLTNGNLVSHSRVYKVRKAILDSSTSVAAGNSEIVTLTAPTGFVIQLYGIFCDVTLPVGGTTGVHDFILSSSIRNILDYIIKAERSYNGRLTVGAGGVINAASYSPSDQNALSDGIRNVTVNSGDSLQIKYVNNTDVAQTNTRSINVYYRLVPQAD